MLFRYDYLSQQYQQVVAEQKREHNSVLQWQLDRQQYERLLSTYEHALVCRALSFFHVYLDQCRLADLRHPPKCLLD